jgi:RNA polymerase sigma-70 factor (ECF subfamily)
MKMEDLAVLVERAQGGDQVAYSEIVQRFHHMAIGYSYAKLGNMHTAEDVAQEAFVALWDLMWLTKKNVLYH